ncbi:MAG: zinc ribbon domain-containing protein [Faecousia sp.]
MAYCIYCGKELPDGAKFCAECGTAVKAERYAEGSQRKAVYEGNIHKCPNCGEILDSFTTVCPSCGYELRGSSATNAVKEFAAKLDNAATEQQKENIIRSFPVPNTKEDIFEFMILASSNIDELPNRNVYNAWIAKFEQCYQKAALSFKQESDFVKIEAIYEKTNRTIKKIRRKGPTRKMVTVVIPTVILAILCVFGLKSCVEWLKNPEPVGTDEENARLEAIVVEVEDALVNKEYDLAMMLAKSIDFFPGHESISDYERQWDIKRDYLIKKIIAEAAKNGITIEYPTDTADEADQGTP